MFKNNEDEESQGDDTLTAKKTASKKDSSFYMHSYSINDLISDNSQINLSNLVFTFNKEYAKCTQMNHMHDIVEEIKNQKGDDEDIPTFNFFLIKTFQL